LCFKSAGHLGRIIHLQPVTWGDDDWPIFGDNGNPVEAWKKPDVGETSPIVRQQMSDEFDKKTLSPLWQWNHNPVSEAWSLAARPGWLRLIGQPAETLTMARNTLTQKLWDDYGTIDMKLDVGNLSDGQRAGLAFQSGDHFDWIGAQRSNGLLQIAWDGGTGATIPNKEIDLRGTYQNDRAQLLFSLDGKTFQDSHQSIHLKFACWKGARPAIFCFGPGNGWADFDFFRYSHA
jgi:beta-xylosidase